MKRGYADTPEGQIYYMTEGEGEPLILLHATGSSRQFWRLMPLLAKEFRVIAPDNLGEGNSDPIPPNVQIEDLARSYVHFMDALGIEKAHVFGLHTGNKIGTEMAAGWPNRVGGFILCGNTHSIQLTREDSLAIMGPIVLPRLRKYEPLPDGSHLVKQWAAEFSSLSAAWWDTTTLTQQKLTQEVLERRKERILDLLQGLGEAEKYRAIFAYDLGARMRDIKVKTLVIEIRVPSEAHLPALGPKLVQRIPTSSLATVEHTAGGMTMEVKAEEFAQLILGFLRTVRQPKAAARR
ncbi:MAG: alpha/beta hydrolase [Dehalococcoidia bacterium]|nr:alpha/beta hydrolase [Dehalococcoidia bacterium]